MSCPGCATKAYIRSFGKRILRMELWQKVSGLVFGSGWLLFTHGNDVIIPHHPPGPPPPLLFLEPAQVGVQLRPLLGETLDIGGQHQCAKPFEAHLLERGAERFPDYGGPVIPTAKGETFHPGLAATTGEPPPEGRAQLPFESQQCLPKTTGREDDDGDQTAWF